MGVIEICSFRSVVEGKTGKEISELSILEFLEKFLAKNVTLSEVEDNTSGLFDRGGIADLPLLRILSAIHLKYQEPSFWEVMDSCFSSIYHFSSFKSPFATITSLPELYFRFRTFILLIQKKKWFLWNMAAAQAAANHRDEWSLAWYLGWRIYTSIPTWSHSQNSLVAAEAPRLRISFHGKSLKNHKDETGHPVLNILKSQSRVWFKEIFIFHKIGMKASNIRKAKF